MKVPTITLPGYKYLNAEGNLHRLDGPAVNMIVENGFDGFAESILMLIPRKSLNDILS